jgi:predicted secreted protein
LKKRTKLILTFLAIVLSGLGIYYFIDRHNYYESGDCDKFELKIGDIFTIKLSENQTTTYRNHWINENKCHCVELLSKEYESSWPQLEGSGGTVMWTFRAMSKGIDTVKISKCGSRIDCNFLSSDLLRLKAGEDSIISRYAPFRQADYTFVVIVD